MEKNNFEEKVYFAPGQVVKLRQPIANKPLMVVQKVERNMIRTNGKDLLKGVKVRWFTDNGFLQEAVFSTKDLILVEE